MASTAQIQNLLSREDCEKILKRSVDQPVQLHAYKISKFHDAVAGFLAEHLRLTIQFTIKNTLTQKTYFVKTLPQFNQNQLDYVEEAGIFRKEVLLYRNLLSEMLKIAHFGPRSYLVKNDCIVLEDLNVSGFRMVHKHDYLGEEHCVSMVKTLARFHASTLIYEDKCGSKLNEKFKEEIKETCFSYVEGQPRQKWLVSTTKCVNDLIKLVHNGKNYQKICDKFHKFVFEEMPVLIAPSKRFRNVLSHDDLWCNNMLFNDKLQCVFVDFQLVRYTPPGYDFILTLLLNLKDDYLEENLHKLIDIYYSTMQKQLKKHGLDLNSILSKNEFEETLGYYKLAALTEAAMYGTHIFISDELSNHIVEDFNNYNEFSFINRSKFVTKEFQDNPQFRDRLCNILVPLIEALNNN